MRDLFGSLRENAAALVAGSLGIPEPDSVPSRLARLLVRTSGFLRIGRARTT